MHHPACQILVMCRIFSPSNSITYTQSEVTLLPVCGELLISQNQQFTTHRLRLSRTMPPLLLQSALIVANVTISVPFSPDLWLLSHLRET